MKRITRQYPPNRVVRRGYTRNAAQFSDLADLVGPQQALQSEPPAGLLTREYSHRPASFESEFLVPFCIASVNATVAAITASAIGLLAQSNHTAAAALLTAAVTFGLSFYSTTTRQLNSLWTREEYGEEIIEPAGTAPPPPPVRVEITEKAPSSIGVKYLDLPLTQAQLNRLVIHLQNGGTFSRDATAHIFRGKEEYPETKRLLLNAGLLREIDRRGAVELTSAGRAILAKVLK